MGWETIWPYIVDLGIAVGGGLISTGLYLAYQRWLTDYSSWPFGVVGEAIADPVVPGNFTGRLQVRNPTTTTAQFDISFLLENGELGWPRIIHAADAPGQKITGWASIRPGDTRVFEAYPGSYGEPILGFGLQVYGPFGRPRSTKLIRFKETFQPLDPAILGRAR